MLGLLNISEAVSIALHTCVSLAEDPHKFHSARQISERFGFSANHFAKITQQLVRSGLLETERGPSGGAKLTRPPKEITLLEIHTAAGGDPRLQGCLLKSKVCKGNCCAMGRLIAKENEKLIEILSSMTLDTVARSLKRGCVKNRE